MSKKYSGYNENDTFWDNYQRERGEMTNREFFTSNGSGGFYDGMVWDEERKEWILNPAEQRKHDLAEMKRICGGCDRTKENCICNE